MWLSRSFHPAGSARLDELQRLHIAAAAAGLREGGAERILAKSFHGMPDGLPGWVEPVGERPPGEFDLPCLEAGGSIPLAHPTRTPRRA